MDHQPYHPHQKPRTRLLIRFKFVLDIEQHAGNSRQAACDILLIDTPGSDGSPFKGGKLMHMIDSVTKANKSASAASYNLNPMRLRKYTKLINF